jgi:thiol-disulfide isomerase/thioredoxin
MTKYSKIITALLFSGTLLLSGCGGGSSNDSAPAASTPNNQSASGSTNAPAVLGSTVITTITGQQIQVDKTATGFIFHGYEGKIVLLEVYGDTCPHCIAAIPSYNDIQARYANDVVVIALESYGSLTHASEQQYITVPKANTGNMFAFIRELTGYSLQAVPYLMILARDGSLVYQNVLADFPKAEIESYIQQLQ